MTPISTFSYIRFLTLLLLCSLSQPGFAQRFVAIGDYGYAGTPETDMPAALATLRSVVRSSLPSAKRA